LPNWNDRRRQIAERYLERWSSTRVRPAVTRSKALRPSWHLFPAAVERPEEKSSFLGWLRQNGVSAGEHYPTVIPDQPALRDTNFVCYGPLTQARSLAAREVSLPIHPYMTDEEVDRVAAVVSGWPA
jgi:dTDP-3-amino-3,4,6-trideoxy-alpha-D-glucose transaminase